MITLHTLGGFEIRSPSPDAPVRLGLPPQPSALLVYLAMARPLARRTRDQVTARLWAELPEAAARGALNQAVFRLRQALGHDVVARDGDGIRLMGVRCDAIEYETALDEHRLEAALDLYGGDLLDGVYLSQSGEFERWIEEERQRLRSRAVAAAVELARQDERNGSPGAAVGRLRQALAWSPFEEPVAGDLVRLLVRCGDRTGAIRAYDRFAARLDADLGLPPPEDLAQFVRELREGPGDPPLPGEGSVSPVVAEAAQPAPAPEVAAPSFSSETLRGDSASRRRTSRLLRVALPGGVLALVAAAGLLLINRRPAPGEHAPLVRRITVAAFDNGTGDSAKDRWGRMAAERIVEGVSGAGLAEVVPAGNRQGGARIAVTGSYLQMGDSLVFRARIGDPVTGALLTAVVEAVGPGQVPEPAVERLGQRTLGALAPLLDERFASWARVASRASSLEAWRLYAAGLDRPLGNRTTPERVGYLLRAAALDSAFTAPLLWALNLSGAAGHFARAESLVTVLEPRRASLAPWDRAMLDFGVAQLQGNFPEAYAAMHRVVELAPSSEWQLELAFWELWTNRPADAIARLARLDPEQRLRPYAPRRYWFTLLAARHLTGDFEGILAAVALMRRDQIEPRLAAGHEVAALAALGRVAEVNRRAEALLATGHRAEGSGVLDAAMELRVHGHLEAADALLRHLVEWYATFPPDGWSFVESMQRAVALFAVGHLSDARREFERIVAEQPDAWTPRGYLGQIAAREGELRVAERELTWQLSHASHPLGGDAIIHAAAIAAELGDTGRAEHLTRFALTRRLYHTHPAVHRDPRLESLWNIPGARVLLRPRG